MDDSDENDLRHFYNRDQEDGVNGGFMKKQKFLVVHLNDDLYCYTDYESTLKVLGTVSTLHTTQLEFLSFKYAERLFVWIYHEHSREYEEREITLGACEGIDREIREIHNLRHMLLSGAFDWYRT